METTRQQCPATVATFSKSSLVDKFHQDELLRTIPSCPLPSVSGESDATLPLEDDQQPQHAFADSDGFLKFDHEEEHFPIQQPQDADVGSFFQEPAVFEERHPSDHLILSADDEDSDQDDESHDDEKMIPFLEDHDQSVTTATDTSQHGTESKDDGEPPRLLDHVSKQEGDQPISLFGAHFKADFTLQSDNARGHFEEDDDEGGGSLEGSEYSEEEEEEGSYTEGEDEYVEDDIESEYSSDEEDEERRNSALLQFNYATPEALDYAVCEVDDDTSIFRMDSNKTLQVPEFTTTELTDLDKQLLNVKSKRHSIFDKAKVKAQSFKRPKASSVKAAAMEKAQSFRVPGLGKSSKKDSKARPLNDVSDTDRGDVVDAQEQHGDNCPLLEDGDDGNGENDSDQKDGHDKYAPRRRDTVKSRRESTRDRTNDKEEERRERHRKREELRKASSARHLPGKVSSTDNGKKRASHIGHGRRRGGVSSAHASNRARVEADQLGWAKGETPDLPTPDLTNSIRQRSHSTRSSGSSRKPLRRTTSTEDSRMDGSNRRRQSDLDASRSRSRDGRIGDRSLSRRRSKGDGNGDDDMDKSLQRRARRKEDEYDMDRSRQRRSSRTKDGENDMDKSKESHDGDMDRSQRRRTSRRKDGQNDMDRSKESQDGDMDKSRQRRSRRKDGENDMDRSKESHDGDLDRSQRRRSSRRKDGENDIDKSRESHDGDMDKSRQRRSRRKDGGNDIDRSKESHDAAMDKSRQRRSRRKDGENDIDRSKESADGTRGIRRGSRRQKRGTSPDGARLDKEAVSLSPLKQEDTGRRKVMGSQSMRIERTTFNDSFPELIEMGKDNLSETFHNHLGEENSDRRKNFMKSLSVRIGAKPIGKGARNLIVGGTKTEKRGLLAGDDDSV